MSAPHAALLMRSPSGPVDPLWAFVTNSTTFDGVNGATTFPNLATVGAGTPFAPNGGSTAQLVNTVSEYGTCSLRTTPADNNVITALDAQYFLGSGDFTVELSVWAPLGNGNATAMYKSGITLPTAQQNFFNFAPSGGLLWQDWQTTTQATLSTSAYLTAEQVWVKYAFCRSGTTARFFINGALIDTDTNSYTFLSNPALQLGADSSGAAGTFYFSNFRFTRAARYTAAYTPDAGPFPVG